MQVLCCSYLQVRDVDEVLNLSEKWIPKCLKIRKTCVELAPIVDTNAVMSLTRNLPAESDRNGCE